METSTIKSGESHTDEEWEQVKNLFVALYFVKGCTLPVVRAELSQRYGFHATTRQYKTRIFKWGLHKKKKGTGWSPGDDAASAKAAKAAKAAKHVRNPSTVLDEDVPETKVALRRAPAPPGHLGAAPVALAGVSRFYSGVLHVDLNKYQSDVRTQGDQWSIRQFYSTASDAPILAGLGQWKAVHRLYGDMLDHVGPLLDERNPILAICLNQVCCRFLVEGQGAVLQRFLKFVDSMAVARGHHSHPLRLMSSGWAQLGDHSPEVLVVCSEEAVRILTAELGPNDAQTLSARRALHTAYTTKGDHQAAFDSIVPVVEAEMALYPGTVMVFEAQFRMARSLLAMNTPENLVAADALVEDLAIALRELDLSGWILAYAQSLKRGVLEMKGELLHLRGDPNAMSYLEEVLKSAISEEKSVDSWKVPMARRHLNFVREDLQSGRPPQPFKFYP